jgi:homoserine acetyltransferase
MASTNLPIHSKPDAKGAKEPDNNNNNTPYKTFPLGDFPLQSNTTLPSAHLAYTTLGHPSSPAILYPTWYSGLIASNLWLLGPDKTLNPEKYYIIIPALLGNSESTSPSNWKFKGEKPFPKVSFYDNVRAQRELVKHLLGEEGRLYAVIGWSMGAGQCFQWATQFPGMMDLVVPFCGSARTSLHNQVFLEGVKSALLGPRGASSGGVLGEDVYAHDAEGKDGEGGYRTWGEGERERGLKAL